MRTINDLTIDELNTLHEGINLLVEICYGGSKFRGWHTNIKTGQPFTTEENEAKFGERCMLIVTEVAEAVEGFRKGLLDDHIKDRDMAEVELADAIIRIGDLVGAMGYDLSGALLDKLRYNIQRKDHDLKNRTMEGGKKF